MEKQSYSQTLASKPIPVCNIAKNRQVWRGPEWQTDKGVNKQNLFERKINMTVYTIYASTVNNSRFPEYWWSTQD